LGPFTAFCLGQSMSIGPLFCLLIHVNGGGLEEKILDQLKLKIFFKNF
jgi:hypothetical protein